MLARASVVGGEEEVVGAQLTVESGDQPIGLHVAFDLAEQTLFRIEQQQGRQRIGHEAPLEVAPGATVLDVDAQQHEAFGIDAELLLGEDFALHRLAPAAPLGVEVDQHRLAALAGGGERLAVRWCHADAAGAPGAAEGTGRGLGKAAVARLARTRAEAAKSCLFIGLGRPWEGQIGPAAMITCKPWTYRPESGASASPRPSR